MSILIFEIEDKADGYVKQRINERLYEVLVSFILMSVRVKSGYGIERGFRGLRHKIFKDLDEGVISIEDEEELNKAEKMINEFFTLAYSDIKEAYYKREKLMEK